MKDLDRKIYFGLQKLFTLFKSQKISGFKRLRLTPLMVDIITYINTHRKNLCTTSLISQELSVSLPTLSDAVSVLVSRDIIIRTEDPNDFRIKYLSLTSKGIYTASELSYYEKLFQKAMANIDIEKKKIAYSFIISVLGYFRTSGDITVFRSCTVCQNFRLNYYKNGKKRHYCKLLKVRLSDSDIKIDCYYNTPLNNKENTILQNG